MKCSYVGPSVVDVCSSTLFLLLGQHRIETTIIFGWWHNSTISIRHPFARTQSVFTHRRVIESTQAALWMTNESTKSTQHQIGM